MFRELLSNPPKPRSAEEAVSQANAILKEAGFAPDPVALKTPADGPDGFSGAALRADLPEEALGALVHSAVVEAAAEQGVSVTHTSLRLSPGGPGSLGVALQVTAKIFVASVEIEIRGRVSISNSGKVEFDSVSLDAGAGMFASMAMATIKPQLDQITSKRLELGKILGRPLEVAQFEFKDSKISSELHFT
jgi:hypothetical protein